MRAYTIHLQRVRGHKLQIRKHHGVFVNITEAIKQAESKYKGWEVSMVWYDWPNAGKAIKAKEKHNAETLVV